MVEKSKYSSHVMKKHFNKELAMTKEDDENFESSTKCWICDNIFVEDDVKEKRPKQEIIVTSLENIEVMHTKTVTSALV